MWRGLTFFFTTTSGTGICQTVFIFFFNDTATTEIYTLSLHDALPICRGRPPTSCGSRTPSPRASRSRRRRSGTRSEEHTSELQSRSDLVCRLLLEKKITHTQLDHARLLPALRDHESGLPRLPRRSDLP